MNELAQFWVSVSSNIAVAIGLFFVWFKLRAYVRGELDDIEGTLLRKLTKEEGDILGGQQMQYDKHCEEIKKLNRCLGEAEQRYTDRKKFVDDRHKVDNDMNNSEHVDITKRLDGLSETIRLNAKSNSVILRILLPISNGNKNEVKAMADEIDKHLLSKIK